VIFGSFLSTTRAPTRVFVKRRWQTAKQTRQRLERFRHLAKKMKTEASLMSGVDKAKTASSAQSDVKIIQNQLEQYVAEVQQSRSHADQNPLKFWVNH